MLRQFGKGDFYSFNKFGNFCLMICLVLVCLIDVIKCFVLVGLESK